MCFYRFSDDGLSRICGRFCEAFLVLGRSTGLIALLMTLYQVYVTNYPWELDIIFQTFPDLLAGIDPAAILAGK